MASILISGGSGLVGNKLTSLLGQSDYGVAHLSRHKQSQRAVETFQWDIKKGYLPQEALDGVKTIIHLAGAGIADKRWTEKRKEIIRNSRVESSKLIYKTLEQYENNVDTVISASAVGYYGDTGDGLVREVDPSGNDFLGETCKAWEKEVLEIEKLGKRVVIIRIGIVLSKDGGALPQMAFPLKFKVGVYMGSGEQYMSWIHLDDLCGIFLKAVKDDNMQGIYNAVAPRPETNKQFAHQLSKTLGGFFSLPAPSWGLKLLMGEMSKIVLNSNKVSSDKILESGYAFKYPTLKSALTEIYG